MTNDLSTAIEAILGSPPAVSRPVSGGDISEARYVESRSGERYFLKFHSAPDSGRMFAREASGLALINASGAIPAPEVLGHGDAGGIGYLLLEWIESVSPSGGMWVQLGQQLAALHACPDQQFGLDEDNFIGSLPQSNRRHDSWSDFYVQERIQPQIRLARDQGGLTAAEIRDLDVFTSHLPELLPDVRPSLIHGDLWGGNIMFDARGPVLIDPAVAYAHGLVDIAMSRLFGGFRQTFYDSYREASGDHLDRDLMEIYQLYYLLVHVNLFGRSYALSVMRIVRRFV